MNFLIADTFTDAMARLPAADQKAAKTSAFDLQTNPQAPGLRMHRIDNSRDPNFWSARVSADLRMIVHRTDSSLLLAYVDRHDKAYAWAERPRIEAHPKTGAIQIVEVRERVEELPLSAPSAADAPGPFARLSDDDLLAIGVPADWLADVRAAIEDAFLELAPRLPAEAAEALLQFATIGVFCAGRKARRSLCASRRSPPHPRHRQRSRTRASARCTLGEVDGLSASLAA